MHHPNYLDILILPRGIPTVVTKSSSESKTLNKYARQSNIAYPVLTHDYVVFLLPNSNKRTSTNSSTKTSQFLNVLETLTRSTSLLLEPSPALRSTRRMQCFQLHLSAATRKTKGLSLRSAAPTLLHHSAQHDFVYRIALKHLKPKTGLHHANSQTRTRTLALPLSRSASMPSASMPSAAAEWAKPFR